MTALKFSLSWYGCVISYPWLLDILRLLPNIPSEWTPLVEPNKHPHPIESQGAGRRPGKVDRCNRNPHTVHLYIGQQHQVPLVLYIKGPILHAERQVPCAACGSILELTSLAVVALFGVNFDCSYKLGTSFWIIHDPDATDLYSLLRQFGGSGGLRRSRNQTWPKVAGSLLLPSQPSKSTRTFELRYKRRVTRVVSSRVIGVREIPLF